MSASPQDLDRVDLTLEEEVQFRALTRDVEIDYTYVVEDEEHAADVRRAYELARPQLQQRVREQRRQAAVKPALAKEVKRKLRTRRDPTSSPRRWVAFCIVMALVVWSAFAVFQNTGLFRGGEAAPTADPGIGELTAPGITRQAVLPVMGERFAEAPAPTGQSAPAPTGQSAPAPTGQSAPAPTGQSAPAPTGQSAPAPTSGPPPAANPPPSSGGVPAPAPAEESQQPSQPPPAESAPEPAPGGEEEPPFQESQDQPTGECQSGWAKGPGGECQPADADKEF